MCELLVTYNKSEINPINPDPAQICIEDIAHALSLLCRANGHIKHFYSVAQHSLNCCYEAIARAESDRVILLCLLHDASEAYLSDITRPVKRHLPEYLKIEHNMQKAICDKFELTNITPAEEKVVKEIDDAILYEEMKALMYLQEKRPVNDILIDPVFDLVDMKTVETEFLIHFYEFAPLINAKK